MATVYVCITQNVATEKKVQNLVLGFLDQIQLPIFFQVNKYTFLKTKYQPSTHSNL